MFLAAVAAPRAQHNFNGRIGIWPVAKLKAAVRSQKFFEKGELKHQLVNMDAELFKKMMREQVCVNVVKATGLWVQRIVVQMDSAGGHGGGKGDISTTTLTELQQWASSWPAMLRNQLPPACRLLPLRRLPTWLFVAQPPRSPDLNMLDLGAWTSIDSLVEEIRHELAVSPIEQIINKVRIAWMAWNSAEKLQHLQDTLSHIYPLIITHQGGNNYEIPHFH